MRNNIFKIIGLSIIIALLSYALFTYFDELNQAEEFNQFLSNAATISEIHNSNSVNFKDLLDFSEVSRERFENNINNCLLYTSPSPRDLWISRMPSSA